jgi:hypothetical protein
MIVLGIGNFLFYISFVDMIISFITIFSFDINTYLSSVLHLFVTFILKSMSSFQKWSQILISKNIVTRIIIHK